jgi:universal stress protein E
MISSSMDHLTSIVVGIDFSRCSATALAQAVRMAAWNRSSVRALHVAEPLVEFLPDPMIFPAPMLGVQADPAESARKAWQEFSPALPGRDTISLDIAIGAPVLETVRYVQEHKADLLLLGAYGDVEKSAGIGIFAGSCVQRAGVRVMLVRKEHDGPFKSVLACVDFSPTSLESVETAARIAAQDNAALHIIHVFREPWAKLAPKAPDPLASHEFQQKYRDALVQHMREFLAPLEHELAFAKPTLHAIGDDAASRGILSAATSQSCDLVVLGATGRSAWKQVMLGSTVARVLREAATSLLVVPRADAAAEAPGGNASEPGSN